MRFVTKTALLAASLAAAFATGSAAPAAAKGCNGYVNQMQWGCAPWDNNNGPQFPHYAAPAAAARPAAPLLQPTAPSLANRNGGTPLIASGGGNLVASGGGNLVASGGGNVQAGGHHPNN